MAPRIFTSKNVCFVLVLYVQSMNFASIPLQTKAIGTDKYNYLYLHSLSFEVKYK